AQARRYGRQRAIGQLRSCNRRVRVLVSQWHTALCALAPLCMLGCGHQAELDMSASLPQHVLIITIDTLRADRLGCYGNRHLPTPNIDRLAREGAMALE